MCTGGGILRAQHCIIIDAENSVLHRFIYHIDVELEPCQLELLLSAALQRRIILELSTVSTVWLQSQGHASKASCSLHSVLDQRGGEISDNADHDLLEPCLIIITWLIMMAKVFPRGARRVRH